MHDRPFVVIDEPNDRVAEPLIHELRRAGLRTVAAPVTDLPEGYTVALAAAVAVPDDIVLPERVVVAVDLLLPGEVRGWLSRGAAGIVARLAPVAEVAAAIVDATESRAVLPIDVLRSMAFPELVLERRLDELDRRLLRAVVSGQRTIDAANELGLSERHLYRRLSRLYAKLGVRNRAEAVDAAAQAQRGSVQPVA
jgi:DNA-binding NarL/FixJ family response regulator